MEIKPGGSPWNDQSTHTPDSRTYVLQRYERAIEYYWSASRINKRWYKWTRYLTVILGAAVTLLASISSSQLITGRWSTSVAVVTPITAAILTVVGGLSQTFQWGAAWQEMVLTAERLERQRDRVMVTTTDPLHDLEALHSLVLGESRGFFTRILGAVQTSGESDKTKSPAV
jgi:Protein of unknown function (DUF4231)